MIAAGSLVHFTSLARAQAIIEAWRSTTISAVLTARWGT
jgi:hypothetical protein